MRYLTPAKISLLVLIEIYAQGAVPNDATIPVLSFIASHIGNYDQDDDPSDIWSGAEDTIDIISSPSAFEQVLGASATAVGLPGRRLWDFFLTRIWDINSLDALHEFYERVGSLLIKTKHEQKAAVEGDAKAQPARLSRNSPFGAFLRRNLHEFRRLQFSDAAKLRQEFVSYRQPTFEAWNRKNPTSSLLAFDTVLMTGQHEWGTNTRDITSITYGNLLDGTPTSVSADDVQKLLEFQVHRLQHTGLRVPPDLRRQFAALLRNAPGSSQQSCWLQCLEAWRSGDYTSAFDYLHQNFDYTMHNKDRTFYHYALLQLAVLQADFGCYQDALDIMLEAISTAREHKDLTCLTFATNWLYHFSQKHPRLIRQLNASNTAGTGKEALAFLKSKAKETGQWKIWSAALLSEAQLALSGGGSVATALEYLVRSSQVTVEHSLQGALGSQAQLSIALWERAGLACQSSMYADLYLRCHREDANVEEVNRVTCRLAGQLATRGRYEDALALLDKTDQEALRSWKISSYWQTYRTLLALRRDLHRRHLVSADYTLSQLLASSSGHQDPDLRFAVDTLHIEALRRRGDLTAAFAKVEKLIGQARDEDHDLALRIRHFLNKVSLFDAMGKPQHGFSLAMRAATLAFRARLMSLLWQAIGAIANILNVMGDFGAAAELIQAIIPRSLEAECSFQTGVLYSILGDAHVGFAGEANPKDDKSGARRRTEYLGQASDAFEQAIVQFKSVEEVEKQLEVMAKKAMITNLMGDVEVANDYATRYLELRRMAMVEA